MEGGEIKPRNSPVISVAEIPGWSILPGDYKKENSITKCD